jgi:hypothetical protein
MWVGSQALGGRQPGRELEPVGVIGDRLGLCPVLVGPETFGRQAFMVPNAQHLVSRDHTRVGTSWGLRTGYPWHKVAATGTNWQVK